MWFVFKFEAILAHSGKKGFNQVTESGLNINIMLIQLRVITKPALESKIAIANIDATKLFRFLTWALALE